MITAIHHRTPEEFTRPAMEQLELADKVTAAPYLTQTAKIKGPGLALAAHLCKLLPHS